MLEKIIFKLNVTCRRLSVWTTVSSVYPAARSWAWWYGQYIFTLAFKKSFQYMVPQLNGTNSLWKYDHQVISGGNIHLFLKACSTITTFSQMSRNDMSPGLVSGQKMFDRRFWSKRVGFAFVLQRSRYSRNYTTSPRSRGTICGPLIWIQQRNVMISEINWLKVLSLH